MTALWIVGGLVGWLMLATIAGLEICRAIRNRDRQIPTEARAQTPERHERTRT